jgi:ABC-2 type transport system ATP-binding protein
MSVALVESASKRFGDVAALSDVSLRLEAGSVVALLGPNGAGKSTLVSLLLGLRAPDRGTVRVCGRDPRDHRARTVLGAAPQELQYPGTLRVAEIVAFAAAHFPDPFAVGLLLEQFGLEEVAQRQAGGLSGGQRRRLGAALAFVGRPALAVLDEPTASLDPEGRSAVWAAVTAARILGASVLLATHDLHEAEAVADRVVLIDRGRVAVDGTMSEVKARAGGSRLSYRSDAGVVTAEVADPGAAVAALVAAGTILRELHVRPLTLEEALTRIRAGAQ